ncbi:hypothetical protein ACJ41O_015015 [Fusarium nematophilum]
MQPTMNVLTGSNRGIPAFFQLFYRYYLQGIGKALFTSYISRPNHTIIAAVRDPDNPSSKALHVISPGQDSEAIPVKLDSASEADYNAAIDTLRSQHGITKLDLVVANAGISNYFGKAAVTHFTINAICALLLFQATSSLLSASPAPKFAAVSSGAGRIVGMDTLQDENTAYGLSKAALNFITRRIHFENRGLISFYVNPGWLQTDLGSHAAKSSGLAEAPVSVEDGVNGLIGIMDKATRQETSGRFWSWDGQELAW